MVTVIKADVDAFLGSNIEQSVAYGILTHTVEIGTVRNPTRDLLPGLAAISRSIEISLVILQPVPVDRCIDREFVEVRSFERGDLAPRGQHRRRHIRPVFSIIDRAMDQSIVGSHP